MIDTESIKAGIDLRDLVLHDLGQPVIQSAKSLMYRCPFHHESKGASLAVWADGWKCFGKCQESGDVFTWVKKFHGFQSFTEVLTYLGHNEPVQPQRRKPRSSPRPQPPPVTAQPPGQEWQFYASRFVEFAEDYLWGPEGGRALRYLREERGLRDYTIKEARLGYSYSDNPDEYTYGAVFDPEWQVDGKTVHCHMGIIIPHFMGGNLWAVRVRRPPGLAGPKYAGIRGGSKALYWADYIEPRLPVLLVEGEFDALVAWQEAGPGMDVEVCPVALGSASNKNLPPNFMEKLISAPVIYSRMDDDQAGESANQVLRQLSGRVKPVNVPVMKDITDLHLLGPITVREWVQGVLG